MFEQTVEAWIIGKDRYGQKLVRVYYGGVDDKPIDVNLAMVGQGLAWMTNVTPMTKTLPRRKMRPDANARACGEIPRLRRRGTGGCLTRREPRHPRLSGDVETSWDGRLDRIR